MRSVIISPIISEKSMAGANLGKFTFKVARKSGKEDVKKAVEDKFKVKVLSVSTTTIKGQTKRTGMKRLESKMTSWKKAVVELEKGQKIDLFDLGAK